MAESWLEETNKLMPERFISEAIHPVAATADTARMAIGEPGLPGEFVWRGRTVTVQAAFRTWRETGRCRHGSPEMYVRRHWYQVATVSDGTMTIYFDRQPRGGRKKPRWWLFSISEDAEGR
jgi:phosphoribosylglycinamide formyltransferase-1